MVNARAAAAELLALTLDERRTLDESFAISDCYCDLEGRERAFAAAIARAALRHLPRVDAAYNAYLERPLPESAGLARALLRVGAAQLLFLGAPAHAAVFETVAAAQSARASRPFARLINAVLRKVSAREGDVSGSASDDLPDWLRARWTAAYGAEAVEAIAAAQGGEPPLDLTVRGDAVMWAERLSGSALFGATVRLPAGHGRGVTDLPGFAEGEWWVQDAAAALPARLLGVRAGERVLDLCAAPGGKTLQLTAAGAAVTALDISQARLERLRRHLERTALSAEVVTADALNWRPPEPFDAILLDAPCTATGTLRRHPEAAWLRTPAHVEGFARSQAALLQAAAGMLKPGGRLVYSVCSLEPEEGAGIVAAALRAGGWRRDPLAAEELPTPAMRTPEGDMRALPCHLAEQGGLDGFYAARLIRG
ncbi:MAG: RsmB/NOP family class I SAM-dependent RNA methyltransferase [Hyphomonadaceae bacterium]